MNDDYWTALAMREQGGSFVSLLGELFHRADDDNRDKIKTTWRDYWKTYEPLGQSLKREDDAKEQDVVGEMLDVLNGTNHV